MIYQSRIDSKTLGNFVHCTDASVFLPWLQEHTHDVVTVSEEYTFRQSMGWAQPGYLVARMEPTNYYILTGLSSPSYLRVPYNSYLGYTFEGSANYFCLNEKTFEAFWGTWAEPEKVLRQPLWNWVVVDL